MIPLSAQIAWFDRHSDQIPELLRGYLTNVVMGEIIGLERERLAGEKAFAKYGDAAFWKDNLQLVGFAGEAIEELCDCAFYLLVAAFGHELRDEYEDTITHRAVAPDLDELPESPDD
jgi:hypothetical protein